MDNEALNELAYWCNYELTKGNRIKASRIYKVFCKYILLKYPNMKERDIINRYYLYKGMRR